MAAKHCIFLAGAPDGERLGWDEAALLSCFSPPIERFLRTANQATASPPKWRSIALDHSNVDISWPSQDQRRATHVRETATDIAHSDFLEHSIAFIEHLDSSQIISTDTANTIDPNEQHETTFMSSATGTDISSGSLDDPSSTREPSLLGPNIMFAAEITDLKRIPKADYIQRIQPQTMTVNLLVGIIAISPSRIVQLRRGKLERQIIEVTVGDETRAGFSITFWLVPQGKQDKPPDDLRRNLDALRPGQVVLLQSLALSCFRGNVYGQSLSTRFARNSTTLAVLSDGVSGDLSHPAASKLQRVSEWTSDFVGIARQAPYHSTNATGRAQERGEFPPDTQD